MMLLKEVEVVKTFRFSGRTIANMNIYNTIEQNRIGFIDAQGECLVLEQH